MSIDKKALPPYDGKIEIGIYWYQDEETGEIIYDFEEMANEFENKLAQLVGELLIIMVLK